MVLSPPLQELHRDQQSEPEGEQDGTPQQIDVQSTRYDRVPFPGPRPVRKEDRPIDREQPSNGRAQVKRHRGSP